MQINEIIQIYFNFNVIFSFLKKKFFTIFTTNFNISFYKNYILVTKLKKNHKNISSQYSIFLNSIDL